MAEDRDLSALADEAVRCAIEGEPFVVSPTEYRTLRGVPEHAWNRLVWDRLPSELYGTLVDVVVGSRA